MSLIPSIVNVNVVSDFSALDQVMAEWGTEKKVKLTEDPLVLAVTAERMFQQNHWMEIDDKDLVAQVTMDDRIKANLIRQHFARKYLWRSLQQPERMSKFQSKVLAHLSDPRMELSREDVGMYIKLPTFYEEDLFHTELQAKHKRPTQEQMQELYAEMRARKSIGFDLEVEFLLAREVWRKKKYHQFWFKDKDGYLFGMDVMNDNQMLSLVKSCFKPGQSYKLHTQLCLARGGEELVYFKMHKMQF